MRNAVSHPTRRVIVRIAGFALAVLSIVVPLASPQAARAAVSGPDFPRLALWGPDTTGSGSVADQARRDWVCFYGYDASHVAALRAANPGILLLGYTNARELDYDLSSYDASVNVELRSASTDWMLTQVGSTLSAAITAKQTSIPVVDGTKFRVTDGMVLVDHELMHLVAVKGNVLTVVRGQVIPAASHSKGQRIASVISHWPDAVEMDSTTHCPAVDVGDGNGPETWVQWNIQRGKTLMETDGWDGLLVDCAADDAGFWIPVYARSIDENRDNRPDSVTAFNAMWDVGTHEYFAGLRSALGPSAVILANGASSDTNLNGCVFETFPTANLSLSTWDQRVMGILTQGWMPAGQSYLDWMGVGRTPAVTTFVTYGTATDYQLMRFGLTSALMGDGYFTYQWNIGHEGDGSWWYDEYDNAGQGTGYLGQPSGAATEVTGGLWRRDFDNGIALVNPTAGPVTVELGGVFRKIQGTQDPKVNDGSFAAAVTIPSHDGIILLRIKTPAAVLSASSPVRTYGQGTTLHVIAGPIPAVACIEQEQAGATSWSPVATMTADCAGTAQLAIVPSVTTKYRVVLVDTGFISNVVMVGVQRRITIRTTKKTVARGKSVGITGTVNPSGRVSITLQRQVNGTWRTVKSVTSASSGSYSIKISFAGRGMATCRAYIKSSGTFLATSSSVVKVRIE